MKDLQKEAKNRIEWYQDFYKSVKSYKNFDSEENYSGFLQRKKDAEHKKKMANEKTKQLYKSATGSKS